jgi:hypothetical protein
MTTAAGRILLSRSEHTGHGVFGALAIPAAPMLLVTAEDDWLDNARGRSCIPAGDYVLERTIYYRHGYETFEVVGVPGRSRILIHPGNTEEDTEGCILVGLRRDYLRVHDEDQVCSWATRGLKDTCPTDEHWVRKRAVVESRPAFHRFMEWTRGMDDIPLSVRWGADSLDPLPAVP